MTNGNIKLELKHLAPYLPYGLKIELLREEYKGIYTDYSIRSYSDYPIAIEVSGGIIYGAMLSEIKPILHPLSDLTKEIEHNGERFVPYHRLQEFLCNKNFDGVRLYQNRIVTNTLFFADAQLLFEWHFDVFNLIEKGLAIDINTLQPMP